MLKFTRKSQQKQIKIDSSEIAEKQAAEEKITDLYRKKVVSTKEGLLAILEKKTKERQQPTQKNLQDTNEHKRQLDANIQQLNESIQNCNSILDQLPKPVAINNVDDNPIKIAADKSVQESESRDRVNHSDEGPSILIQTQNFSKTARLKQTLVNTENNIQKDLPKGVKHAVNSGNTFSFSQLKTSKLQQDIKKQENQDKPLPTPSGGLGVNDELAKKVAGRALLNKQDNINTGNVSYSKELVEKQDIQKQHLQTRKLAVNSNNSVPLNHGLNMSEELARIFAERNNNGITEKDKVISFTTNVSPDEQSKLSERAAVEVQVQKNTDNIPASEQTQNSQDNFSLLQQLKASRKQLIHIETTVQEDNLPDWVKSEFIDSAAEKKLLEEKKEHDLFNFLETVCHRTDLSEEDSQEIIKFHDKVYNVKLRVGNEAEKKQFRNAVSKIVEEITRPNSICDAEYNNNLKIINEFINENNTQQQSQNSPSLQPRR